MSFETGESSDKLMPGAAFDDKGNRIIMEAVIMTAFYRRWGRYIGNRFMLAFEMQWVKEVEAEACDIRVNRILTDREVNHGIS